MESPDFETVLGGNIMLMKLIRQFLCLYGNWLSSKTSIDVLIYQNLILKSKGNIRIAIARTCDHATLPVYLKWRNNVLGTHFFDLYHYLNTKILTL